MSMNPDELVSFANTFSNSASGPMAKKKSAAQRRRAKAKGLKNAAYVALGSPAGKKTKNSGGKSTAGSKSTGKGMTGSTTVVASKPIVTPANKATNAGRFFGPQPKKVSNAGPYLLPAKKAAAPSATQTKNSNAATTAMGNRNAAYVALGQPKGVKKKAAKASGLPSGSFGNTTAKKSANAGPYVMPPKKTTKSTTGNGPSKPSASRASSY